MTIANMSGGRDSTAMVVKWLEEKNNLDYIIFCDTGFEFKTMYEYIKKLDKYLQTNFNKSITILNARQEIEKWAFDYPITRGVRIGKLRGLPMRLKKDYCTRETKIKPTRQFVISKSPNKFKNTCLIGYTYNEVERGRVSNLDYAIAKYPLHEWNMNEKEVTEFLVKRKIMNPLYNHFGRTGCFICPKQSKKSLYNIYNNYPYEWQIMKKLEFKAKNLNCINQNFKDKSLIEYENEFQNTLNLTFSDIYTDYETCFCGK